MVNYEFLLNKDDRRCYKLLRYLETRNDLVEKVIIIQEDLSFSSFVLKKTLDKLIIDIDNWKLTKHFKITMFGSEISLEIDGSYSSKFIFSKYMQQSISFHLLLAYLKKEYKTLESFSEKFHISYSSVYSLLTDIKKHLRKYQIYFDKKNIYGNQKYILSFFYQLFLVSDTPFNKVCKKRILEESRQVVRILEHKYHISIYEKKKLTYFLILVLTIEDYQTLTMEANTRFFFSDYGFKELRSLLPDNSENLIYSVMIWLYLEGNINSLFIYDYSDTSIVQLNDSFIHTFEENFKLLNKKIKGNIYEELTRIHFNILYYPINRFEELELNIYFFKKTYPDYYSYLLEYVKNIPKKYTQIPSEKNTLFFYYLMLLINHVPIQIISEPVSILLDFSYGFSYNQFIKKNLGLYVNLNVNIIDTSEPYNPDVILTNVNDVYRQANAHVVVWLDPPRVIDWGNLTRILLDVQKNKSVK
ncbi:helix-turn-helix domain-containing protein [Enterococcus ureasiticus]|uniref:helix-turn-helix domain-containing protein n=1 Tax=Enterococcus ureasiticus TaxID=903984 RepID=UPI001A90C209|nr:helix-turn-helix domain-containing protein [Enterococcus ureasiticus]MBO0473891.1 helix-turn-helix domain-containing protein [Enterococcus ureasiticus]